MNSPDTDTPPPFWHQRPRPVGFVIAYRIKGDELEIDSTRKVDRVKLAAIEQVRFTFAPSNISSKGFKTQLRLGNGGKVSFGNLSWRSVTEIERDDAGYRAFVEALAAAIAQANPRARFVAGKPRWLWLTLAIVSGLLLVILGVFTARAFLQGAAPAGWLGIALAAASVWQVWPMVRLNRPQELRTGEVPDDLVPRPST
ncbi:hypothetical protein DWF00_06775 [Bosea caraganae]|uniref:Uncharacterized protein n=1 Tax=Bosea caraganae TaxID=2763117 RepID=A0A370L511_9HYPH|nr:hypothetical protein [Bosea caraganae]RDJ23055.1 hypothetical protein DWE98_18020 [Bosea caraganae]RDJ28835.1 hypothetical protein DWF00_06775 [Bosea caraganae]